MTHVSCERRSAGELETAVMAALRDAGVPLTPERVRSELGFGLARTTVATTLTRLHEKGVVSREHQGRGYACLPWRTPRV